MQNWALLGHRVVARRCELGFTTRQKFSQHAGLSPRLLADLETGKRTSYQQSTFVKLERALRWRSGSSPAVLSGEDPETVASGVGTINRNIAGNLRRLRRLNGWSIARFAAVCAANGAPQLTEASLAIIEQAQPDPSKTIGRGAGVTAEELYFFADLFGVPIEAIAGRAPCETCHDEPPAGFTCNTCGAAAENPQS